MGRQRYSPAPRSEGFGKMTTHFEDEEEAIEDETTKLPPLYSQLATNSPLNPYWSHLA